MLIRIAIFLVIANSYATYVSNVKPVVDNQIAVGQMQNSDEAFVRMSMNKDSTLYGWGFVGVLGLLLMSPELRKAFKGSNQP